METYLSKSTSLHKLSLVAIAFLLSIQFHAVFAQENNLTAHVLTNPVTLDGRWTTVDEWMDAAEVSGQEPDSYFRAKHDGDALYVLADYASDASVNQKGDVAWVYIDTLRNGGTTPQTDDYAFSLQWVSRTYANLVMQTGTGTGWKETAPALHSGSSSTDASNDPHSNSSHVIYEFRIPKSVLPQGAVSVGMRLAMRDATNDRWTVWPRQALYARSDPGVWAQVDLSSTAIPEFSSYILLVTASLALPLYLLKRPPKRFGAGRGI